MNRLYVASTALLLVNASLVTVGCGGANHAGRANADYETPAGPPVELAVDRVFFIPGEQFTWDISLRDIVGGKAVMATGQPGRVDGKSVIIVRSEVSSAGMLKLVKDVRDHVVSWIDLETGSPIKHDAKLKFGDKRSEIATVFETDGYHIDYHRIGKRRYQAKRRMPSGEVVHDGHSILGPLRAWQPEEGSRAFFYVLSGRRLWRNDVILARRETIKSALGVTAAIRIEGVARRINHKLEPQRHKPRYYTVWISDDANRVPVRVTARTEYGVVKVELARYDRPAHRLVWR